jgi:glycerophosphoryl diester phosphodiesterase
MVPLATMRVLGVVLLGLATVACGESRAGGASASSTGGGGDGTNRGLDPALYDCRATAVPPRTSPVELACTLDASCPARLVVGHRAAGGELGVFAPENSLAAVRAAIAMGVDVIETDPRVTKDGVVVNVHDATLDRTTNGTGEVSETNFAAVSSLSLESAEYPGEFACERIPTIEDVLLAAKGKVHVLLDANKTNRVDLLVAAVQATDTLDWAIFDTDEVAKIDAALALEPRLLTMIRVADADELTAELAHFAAHPPTIVEVDSAPGYEAVAAQARAAGMRTMVNVFGLDLAAGLTDDPSAYGTVFDGPLDLVQTDRPDLVLRHLGRYAGTPKR